MSFINRMAAAIFFFILLSCSVLFSVVPFTVIDLLHSNLTKYRAILEQAQQTNPTNFIIGQATLGIASLLVLGLLFWLTISGQKRGAVIHTVDGSSAELDTNSIGRRLEWHLEQVAEINNVIPIVKARGGAVDIRLEIEVAPESEIPMKTDEVVILTRNVIEEDIGLRLGKLDVHLRCAPIEPIYS